MDKPDVIVVRASVLALCALVVIGCSERMSKEEVRAIQDRNASIQRDADECKAKGGVAFIATDSASHPKGYEGICSKEQLRITNNVFL